MKILVYSVQTKRVRQELGGSSTSVQSNLVLLDQMESYLEVPDDFSLIDSPQAYRVINDEVVYSPKPSPVHTLNATGEWEDSRSIATIRTALIERLRVKRESLIESGFSWDGSSFDSDSAISQPRLLGLFTTAVAGGIPPEGYPWRLADNTWRVLSAADAVSIWGAFQAHMAGLFAAFAAHEAAVLAETDIEVLRTYNVEAGWPS